MCMGGGDRDTIPFKYSDNREKMLNTFKCIEDQR